MEFTTKVQACVPFWVLSTRKTTLQIKGLLDNQKRWFLSSTPFWRWLLFFSAFILTSR